MCRRSLRPRGRLHDGYAFGMVSLVSWPVQLVIAAAFAAGLIAAARPKRAGVQLVVAFMLVALAGYAWQGRPDLPSQQAARAPTGSDRSTPFARERKVWFGRFGGDALVLDAADAFIRNGDPSYAAGIVRGELSRRPESAVLWIGYAEALVAYADGMLTPGARAAYQRAIAYAPDHPGPAYFYALARAQAGELDGAEETWRQLVRRDDAPEEWRALIEQKLVIAARIRGEGTAAP
jgi:cytochrome c-type biogenesis protein CcmH